MDLTLQYSTNRVYEHERLTPRVRVRKWLLRNDPHKTYDITITKVNNSHEIKTTNKKKGDNFFLEKIRTKYCIKIDIIRISLRTSSQLLLCVILKLLPNSCHLCQLFLHLLPSFLSKNICIFKFNSNNNTKRSEWDWTKILTEGSRVLSWKSSMNMALRTSTSFSCLSLKSVISLSSAIVT